MSKLELEEVYNPENILMGLAVFLSWTLFLPARLLAHLATHSSLKRKAMSKETMKSLEDELDKILGELYGVPAFHFPKDKDGKPSLEKTKKLQRTIRKQALEQLIKDECTKLLDRVEAELIGEDFKKPPLGDFWNVGRNQLKAFLNLYILPGCATMTVSE